MLWFDPAAAKPSVFPILGNHLTHHIALSDSEWVATQAFLSIDHTLTLPSKALFPEISFNCFKCQEEGRSHPLKRYSPVWLQSSDITHAECPAKFATCSPDDVS
jgi:hypothetical protein